jgi:micrococcal nuclease
MARRYIVLGTAVMLGGLAILAADRAGWLGERPPGDYEKYHGRTFEVVKVIDGDTLDVNAPDGPYPATRIRLWGVDTPEAYRDDAPPEHFARRASQFTKRMTAGKTVRLELDPRDTRGKHGRLLAYVYLPDGRMLNRLLVSEGYAYADPRWAHEYERQFARLQRQARKARRGLWENVQPADLPDWVSP